jgi:hypothetical protein
LDAGYLLLFEPFLAETESIFQLYQRFNAEINDDLGFLLFPIKLLAKMLVV